IFTGLEFRRVLFRYLRGSRIRARELAHRSCRHRPAPRPATLAGTMRALVPVLVLLAAPPAQQDERPAAGSREGAFVPLFDGASRSEERRVGKEGRSG